MRKIMKAACTLTAAVFCACMPAFASGISEGITMHKTASYSSGEYNVDGGVMEIIAYNKSNQKAYAVNGQSGVLAAIDLGVMEGNGSDIELSAENIDIRSLVGEMDSSFSYGDMTSVAVSPDGSLVALALQDASFDEDGRAAIFSCNEDGSLTFKALVRTGVQPDMITFADDNTILTADEGEPREGYGEGIADPAGSVSIIDVNSLTSTVVGFEAFDSSADELASQGVIIMKGVLPSADFEPEYIAVSEGKAYVTLQEANAVAVLDIGSASFDGIYSIGFEDYSIHEVDIDKKDDAYNPRTYDSLRGIRMPDGIAAFTANGATYIATANEGDAREWGDEDDGTFYISEDERDFGDGDTSPTGAITAGNSGLEGKVRRIEVSALTTPENDLARRAAQNPHSLSRHEWEIWYCTAYVSAIAYQIDEVLTDSRAKPVLQVAASEGAILQKTQLLMLLLTLLSLACSALAISNLVTANVMERSTEIGLLKALGATNGQISLVVLAEILIATRIVGAFG